MRTEGIHLTLKFLGDVEESKIDDITAAVVEAVQGSTPFIIGIAGTGAFPDFRRPRVLWIGLYEPLGQLSLLAEKININLLSLGFPSEKRAFKPHLTLARIKDSRHIAQVISHFQDAKFSAGEFEAREIVIMKSQLKPTGAEYTPLRRIPLGSH